MFHSPQDVAKLLQIKETTLRKYALLLEKHGDFTFNRNKNQQRWYTDKDVIALRRLITLKNNGAMSLEEAAEAMKHWQEEEAVTVAVTATDNAPGAAQKHDEGAILSELSDLREIIAKQGQQIESLARLVQEQNALLQERNKELPEPGQPEEKTVPNGKRGFFSFFRRDSDK